MMVTHDPRIAAYADRIVFLKDGSVVDDTRLTRDYLDNSDMVTSRMHALAE
jgi:putative ABC transport system ATP-binding protein